MALAEGPAPGSVFQGGYEILGRLGLGGFGRVYKARQLSTGQDVALKMVRLSPDDSAADVENHRARFRREMRLCAGLWHPSIVSLVDSGETDDGALYAVFEYVPGITLREVLAAEGRLAVGEALHLMTQVLDALACAHARGVVHRDLKPDNVMITKTGVRRNALVLDFGLSGLTGEAERLKLDRLTRTRDLMGTPGYAAPEQLRGEPTTARSDLYSWGLVFLECLTGESPIGGATAAEVIVRQLGPEPVAIPAWLRAQPLGRVLEAVTVKAVDKRHTAIPALIETLGALAVEHAEAASEQARAEELPDGERRQLTVVSCRVSVSALDGHPLDPEEIDDVLHAQQALYAELAARAGGQVAGILADRMLLVFGFPRAREDDARRGARTALVLAAEAGRAASRLETDQRLRLEVRFGVHTGLVVIRQLAHRATRRLDDLVGLTAQLAARLDEAAAPGEVLASAATERLLRGAVATETGAPIHPWSNAPAMATFRLVADRKARTAETIPWVRETPLVGRLEQQRRIQRTWDQAQAGHAGAVVVLGEPGIGKSRLVRELRRRVPPERWLEGRCVAENRGSPLRPIVDLLLATRQPIDALLARHGFDLADTMPLFAALLSLQADPAYPPLAHTAERTKELTLAALLTLVLRMAEESPIVLALEDLHWADPTTLEFATQLVGELRSLQTTPADPRPRLCVVLTARPEFGVPWSLEEVGLIQLSRLTRADVEEMIAAGIATRAPLPPALLEKVVQRSDGVPLFVEEVTRMLADARAFGDELDPLAVADLALEIPASLRDLLTARLDRLSPSARETMQLGAVLGREFRYELLSAVARKDEALLREDLRELLDAGLLFARRSLRSEGYVFKHSLVRDAAYDSLTRARRQGLHLRVGTTLRHRFPDVEQNQPELLAQHFEQGGGAETAVDYWHRAGQRAFQRAAHAEARQQLERGLGLLAALPPSRERVRRELELRTTLGTVLFSTMGYAAAEVEDAFARSRALCEELGEDMSLPILWGIMSVHMTRGDRAATSELLPRFRRLAQRDDDAVSSILGHTVLGLHAFWCADFAVARDHLAPRTRLYGTEAFQRFTTEYGYDGGLYCHAYLVETLWVLGYPDRAQAVCNEMLALAERTPNPYSNLLALGFAGMLACDRGEADVARERSERMIALATEQRLPFWLAAGHCERAGSSLLAGDAADAIADARRGLDLYRTMGVRLCYGYFLTYLAAAYRDGDEADAGLRIVDEGIALCAETISRFHEAELWRLRGELLHRRHDPDAAEASLRRALELASRQQARGYELRAATSLARLLREQRRTREAHAVLAPVVGWFAEGAGTRDVRVATALLGELS